MNQTGKMSSEFSGSSHVYARLFSLVFMLAHCDYVRVRGHSRKNVLVKLGDLDQPTERCSENRC